MGSLRNALHEIVGFVVVLGAVDAAGQLLGDLHMQPRCGAVRNRVVVVVGLFAKHKQTPERVFRHVLSS